MGGGSDDTFLYPLVSLTKEYMIFAVMTYTSLSFFEGNEEGNEEDDKEKEE